MSLAAGQTLSHYEILGPLGAGAMGEVYRARDTRLEREVALKVVPEELAHDTERLLRFEREAKSLACLSHPNVAHVYGIDQVEDTCFMTMELVPGEDLALRIARGPLSVAESLDLCRQIAEALEAAHEAGVIHRDLKPANVVVTPEGKAKVLDFGLAKPAAAAAGGSPADGVLTTEAGRLLGTPTFMAPEQVRGKPIDKRVDVWAFGCVLYECLSARPAFAGETVGDVLAAVLEKEPDWSWLPSGTPAHVRKLLARCLDKDPLTRLRDAGEARIALTGGGEVDEAAAPAAAARVRPRLVLVALVAGALLAVAVMRALWPEAEPPNPLDGATFTRLTDFGGTQSNAAITPNGDFIAFASDRDGPLDLWVAQIEGGEPVNLTQGRYAVAVDPVRTLGFDGNGSRVWFLNEGTGVRVRAAPKTGGTFEPLLGPDAVEMDWTTDGSRLVHHTNAPGDPVHVREANAPAGDPILVERPGTHLHFPMWSFDEEWLFLVRGSQATGDMNLWRMRPDGSEAEQLTREQMFVSFPTPIDANTVLFVAQDAVGSGPWLWSLDLSGRSVRRVSVGTEQYLSLAASADGRRLVATVANPKAALWHVPIQAELAREADAELLPGVPSVRALAPRFGGGELFYLSSRGSGDGLYMRQEDRARKIWSGTREPLVFLPSIAPDGSRVALVRRQGSRMVLSILGVAGKQTLHVFDGPVDVRGSSSWSPMGDWIVVGGIGPEGPGLFRFPGDGGSPEEIAPGIAKDPVWSPTDDLIVYCGEQVGPMLPLRAVRSDGTPVELSRETLQVRVGGERTRFLPDGSGLVYLTGSTFWHLDLATGRTRRLAELDRLGSIRTFDVTPDGRTIVFDRIQQNSDIVLIERPERHAAE